jgi:predicted RNA-binding protein YlqC (UPF0109 family)
MSSKENREYNSRRQHTIDEIREFVLAMVRGVVDKPDEVEVYKEMAGLRNVVLEVVVAESDVGIAVGRDGTTVDAMRVLLFAKCKRHDLKYSFDISGASKIR